MERKKEKMELWAGSREKEREKESMEEMKRRTAAEKCRGALETGQRESGIRQRGLGEMAGLLREEGGSRSREQLRVWRWVRGFETAVPRTVLTNCRLQSQTTRVQGLSLSPMGPVTLVKSLNFCVPQFPQLEDNK